MVSWITLLSGQYQVTTRALQSLLKEQWDLEFSLGAISQAQGAVTGWLEPLYAQIGEAVRQANVAHADETDLTIEAASGAGCGPYASRRRFIF